MSNEIKELLQQTGLDWNVRTETITTESGINLDGYTAIIREDNNTPLSVRSDSYQPYQNHELLELLHRVSQQTGLPIHKGGYFGDGQKVYIQLKSNNLTLGTDRIEGFVTGVNSFDGSTSLAFGNSNVTISCQNTFFAAFRDLKAKVRHTVNMGIKIDEICRNMDKALVEEKNMFDSIVRMSETSFDKVLRDDVTRKLFNIEKNIDLNDEDAISSVTRNKMSRFYIDLNGELKDKGDNMWGLFSGITKYTTHSMVKGDSMESKLFGTYGNRERVIFNELVEMV